MSCQINPQGKSLSTKTKPIVVTPLKNIKNFPMKFGNQENQKINMNSSKSQEEVLKIKEKLIIKRIAEQRKISALKIQNAWKNYLLHLQTHKLAHHVDGCYTISTSIKNVTKLYIKIFTNDFSNSEFKIIPLYFCPIRKSFLIDIPKNKFYGCQKILHFNFIYQNKVIFDPNYQKVFFIDDYVHEINLNDIDKNKETSSKIYNEFLSKINSKDSENSTEGESFAILKKGKTQDFSDSEEYSGLRARNFDGSDEKIKINRRKKKYESCHLQVKIKLQSILLNSKDGHSKKEVNNGRKVSFGSTVYSY